MAQSSNDSNSPSQHRRILWLYFARTTTVFCFTIVSSYMEVQATTSNLRLPLGPWGGAKHLIPKTMCAFGRKQKKSTFFQGLWEAHQRKQFYARLGVFYSHPQSTKKLANISWPVAVVQYTREKSSLNRPISLKIGWIRMSYVVNISMLLVFTRKVCCLSTMWLQF